MGSAPIGAARSAGVAALVALGVAALTVAGCADRTAPEDAARSTRPGAEHGLVLTRSAGDYLLVVDVLAPEPMFTAADLVAHRPADGELVVEGRVAPVDGADVRHLEVHVYDLRDGEPVRDVRPVLTLVDHTAGRSQPLDATLMHDLAIGPRDDHFGTNAPLPAGHRFTLRVELAGTTTEFTGVLP